MLKFMETLFVKLLSRTPEMTFQQKRHVTHGLPCMTFLQKRHVTHGLP